MRGTFHEPQGGAAVKLKLHRECLNESEARSLRFPAHAVRAMPVTAHDHRSILRQSAPPSTRPRVTPSIRPVTDDPNVMRHPEMIRQLEATLDRMQSSIDQLHEQVDNFKFPTHRDEERPRAA